MTPESTSPVPADASWGGPWATTRVCPEGGDDDRRRALEQHHLARGPAARRAAARRSTRQVAHGLAQKSGQFAGVGREHQTCPPAQAAPAPAKAKSPSASRTAGWRALEDDPADGVGRSRLAAQAGTDDHGPEALVGQDRQHVLRVVEDVAGSDLLQHHLHQPAPHSVCGARRA